MKKIKWFAIFLLAFVCLFSLFGCGAKNYSYVENSLTYNRSSTGTAMDVRFSVDFPKSGNYKVSYTLELYRNNKKIARETFKTNVNSNGGENAISKHWIVDETLNSFYTYEVRVTDLKASSKNSLDDVKFAVGFGVTGGVILIGVVTLFIVLKKRETK